jgi:KaiC/GvpD/RAD55 family RecA-like ATPase
MIGAAEGGAPFPEPDRVSTGTPGLDRMLGGGLIPGRPYLVTGGTGSGKTLLGLTFLLEGVRRREDVLLVAVDEPPGEIMENVRAFNWDLSSIATLDANPGQRAIKRMHDVQEIRALGDLRAMREYVDRRTTAAEADEISIQSIHLKLRQQMQLRPFRRVVVDSITSIRRFALKESEDPQAERTEIQSLLRFLSERETTTLITATPHSLASPTPEEILTRGEIVLSRKWIGDRSLRQVKILRMRGSAHDYERRPFTITPQGIVVA